MKMSTISSWKMDPHEAEAIERYWSVYFPFDDLSPTSPWMDATRLLRKFFLFHENGKCLLRNTNLNLVSQVTFDYSVFVQNLSPDLEAFEQVLRANGEVMVACLGLALCSLRDPNEASSNDSFHPRSRPITPRFVNLRPLTPLTSMKADLIGRFVSIRGNVVRVQGVRPLVKRMEFECLKCGCLISKDMVGGFVAV